MARIAGVDVPNNKRVEVSLQYIFGIGPTISRRICLRTQVEPETMVRDLTEEEVARLRDVIDRDYLVEGDLRREVNDNIKRLTEINCYRGVRHRLRLPVHGQRTHTNARAKRGQRRSVAAAKRATKK